MYTYLLYVYVLSIVLYFVAVHITNQNANMNATSEQPIGRLSVRDNSSKDSKINATSNGRTFNMPTIQQFITSSFQNELKHFRDSGTTAHELNVGDKILARMREYNPWPARIIKFSRNRKIVDCFFYGTHNCGPVGINNVIPFVDSIPTVRLICLRKPVNFMKGVKEIEIDCGVPEELSCLKDLYSIES